MLMFLTPVIYPISFLPERWRWLLRLNPLSGIIEGFRDAVFGRPFNWEGLAISALVTLGLLVGAAFVFSRMEEEFADVI
jgi:lipopolysaccharide transport system permease protein